MHAGKTGFGPTLLGGVVGAAIGVGLHAVLETGFLGQPIEAPWFAVVIGLLTGLGVRQANRPPMPRSYLRGAVSGVLALAAIVGSMYLISQVMQNRDATAGRPLAAGSADGVEAPAEPVAEAAPEEPAEEPAPEPPLTLDEVRPAVLPAGQGKARPADANDPWVFVFMAIGALVAYEFGRGGGAKPIDEMREEPIESAPVAANPSE